MAKDKKAKKGQGEETGEEVASKETSKNQDVSVTGSMKKNKRNKKTDDLFEDSVTEELSSLSLQDVKKSKSKAVENGDPDDNEVSQKKTKQKGKDADGKKEKSSKKSKSAANAEDEDSIVETKTKKKAKSKRSGAGDDSDDDILSKTSLEKNILDEGSDDERKKKSQKSASKSQKKSKGSAAEEPEGFSIKTPKFQLLDIEDDDMNDMGQPSEEEKEQVEETKSKTIKEDQKGGKKAKKKARRKKDDDDDEDLEKLLEELAIEMTGQKPEKAVEKPEVAKTEEVKTEGDKAAAATAVVNEANEATETKTKKKKKKKEVVDQDKMEDKDPAAAPTDEQHTMKSAAEKKKEKKEREKQKRIAEFERQAKSAGAGEAKAKPPKQDDVPPVAPPPTTEKPEVKEEEDKDDEDDADDKKKKKKKKKGEEEKKDKKRPGKKQIAAMQEALKQMQEEEERLRQEEEARIKAEEEAERQRLEKLRLEQEKKEKKKQKEKEKRERLKAEGKLLTKAQRQQRARMEATLAALRQQGVEVPQIGERKEKVPRLGDRQRNRKDKTKESSEEPEKEATEAEKQAVAEKKEEIPVEGEEKGEESSAAEENEDDVKDAWDETSDEEEGKSISKKIELVIKSKKKAESDESQSEEETDSSDESDEESDSEDSSSESEAEGKTNEEKLRERALERIRKRREEAELNRSVSKLRSPVVCVLGHVDTGKTKILDKIRKTNVQTNEVGGITQQIGATMVPQDALKEQCKMVKGFTDMELQVPGLLIIDTPGHESFSNLRSRGSSLCDIAILVVDIMHGLEPQTIESINLLKQKKTPFIVALNKVDRLYEWKSVKSKDIQDVIKGQSRNTKMEFDDRAKDVILQFANQGLNAVLYYDNKDPRSYVSMVPTSAITGDGMGNLMALVVQLTQSMMAKRLAFSEDLQATVLEVKAIPGLGTTVDVILVNGRLREGDTILLAGYDGPVVTQIRSLLMPQPLKELRVKSPYQEFKEVEGAQGVKITGKDLDKAIAGLQLLVAHHPDEVPVLKDEIASSFKEAMSSIKLAERGVYVQASTLGSLEALLDFLRTSKIPYSGIRIGPVVKKDVMKASIMLEHDSQYAVILAFDVKIERDAQELADSLSVRIFQADIIYHLFDRFMEYREELKNKRKDEFKNVAVFPCKLRILPQFIFNSRDPIVVGVIVEAGVVKEGTPLCVPTKEFLEIGTVSTIEVNHKQMDCARKGQEVCIKIEPVGGEAPKMYGRHFDHTDMLVSKITRQSIDVCKEYFRDDLAKTDWQLMVELKKIFQIL